MLPAFDNILSMLETAKVEYTKYVRFAAGIDLVWQKLADYYEKSDISKVYLISAVLDPQVKMRYFKKSWKKDWLIGAHGKLDKHWEEFTIAIDIDIERSENERDNPMDDSEEAHTMFGSWRQADDEVLCGTQSEWEKYLVSGCVKDYPGFSVVR